MNFQTQYLLFSWIQVAWVIASAFWFWKRRDELPLVISGFLFYVFSFRFWALLNGLTVPVDITPFGFEGLSFDTATSAFSIAVLGESVLLATYMFVQRQTLSVTKLVAPPKFLNWFRSSLFTFAGFAIIVSEVAKWRTGAEVEAGKAMAYEVSAYLYELPLMLISVAIMVALLWKCGGLQNTFQQCLGLLVLALVAVLTFGPTGRFQFLGWVLAVTVIISTGDTIGRRFVKIALGFVLAMVLFATAGALRTTDDDADLQKDAWQRFVFAEDANMLDGMVLLRQVYPDRLPFSYGEEHLEILERPIPRALWPDKPVGGYMNKLGLTLGTGFTLGISPSLLGSFYQEGGIPAVIVLSAVYGYILGWLVRFSTRINSFSGALVRAICCASIIPLLRGGDLPGIYAWIFMAFWPCFLLMIGWRRDLFVQVAAPAPKGWRRFRGLSGPATPKALARTKALSRT